jgi:hypothetical protein
MSPLERRGFFEGLVGTAKEVARLGRAGKIKRHVRVLRWQSCVNGSELVVTKPPAFKELGDFQGVSEGVRFLDVGVGAEFVGALNIVGIGGGTVDNDHQLLEGRLLAEPVQHFEAASLGELKIEQNQARERVAFAVGERPAAGEVIDSHLTVGDDVEGAGNAGALENSPQHEDVGLFVFDLEDGFGYQTAVSGLGEWVGASGEIAGSSSQKVEGRNP